MASTSPAPSPLETSGPIWVAVVVGAHRGVFAVSCEMERDEGESHYVTRFLLPDEIKKEHSARPIVPWMSVVSYEMVPKRKRESMIEAFFFSGRYQSVSIGRREFLPISVLRNKTRTTTSTTQMVSERLLPAPLNLHTQPDNIKDEKE